MISVCSPHTILALNQGLTRPVSKAKFYKQTREKQERHREEDV
jgi:hypothetical protein